MPLFYDRTISHQDTLFELIHFPEGVFIFHFYTQTETQSDFLPNENEEKKAFVSRECILEKTVAYSWWSRYASEYK